ncbi:MAG: ABC transporter ATP-binding protein [Proteobacteria bacterium]|nr:ABC transporter ATP-binding protein [Pseudomonadota bacterium]
MSGSLLAVRDLHVAFHTRGGVVDAVRGVDFELAPGDTLAIVGESGSGKSVTAYSVMQLLDRSARIKQGQIVFRGEDITRAAPSRMKALRGAAISIVFQSPRTALNPIRPIGRQVMDALSAHEDLSATELRARALELLEAVRIRDAEQRFDAYPEQLSGGMCQRVMIAMAIACNPALLIADEPTTGLDVTTQKTVMDLLARLIAERNMGLVLITHDLGLAARYCRNVMVMEKGLVVERAPAVELFSNPVHPYTRKLVAASPTFESTVQDLVGAPPAAPVVRPHEERGTPLLLDVQAVTKRYSGSPVVDQVSLTMRRGESVGLVGESGSGKSTLSRMICRLIDHDGGSVIFDGQDIGDVPARDFHASPLRRDIQIVFQDPHESLNPRFSAFDCIAHPVRRLLKLKDGAELRQRVEAVADRCGLPRRLLPRFPHQLSGGEKARVGIARAIAVEPRLLVLDEPTAALDVSVQAVVLKLLDDLRRDDGLAFLFVSHDLNVVRMMCERIVVMRRGTVVEEGASRELFCAPRAEYTRDLLASIPHFERRPSLAG